MKRFRREKTPTIIQMEITECGAVSLAIILGYYGKYTSLEELRGECGVSRDGSKASHILKAAEKYGLKGKGYRYSLEELQEIDLPAILFWGFNHFLVLEGFGKNKVFLNDPAVGPRSVTYEELDEHFTGIALVFHPTQAFHKSGSPFSIWRELIRRLRPVATSLFYLFLAGVCLLLPGLAFPAFIRVFVDHILVSHVIQWPFAFLGGMLLVILTTCILKSLQQFYLNRLGTRLSLQFSSEFLWHILRLPLSFYAQRFSGEIAYRATSNDQAAQIMTSALATTCVDLLLILFYGIILFQYSVPIGFVAIGAGLVNLGMMLCIQRSRKDAYARLQQETGKSISCCIETIQQIQMIKSMAGESNAFSRFMGYYANYINANQEIEKKDALLSTCPALLQGMAIALLLSIGSFEVMRGTLTVGMLIALQTLMLTFLAPVSRFVNFGQTIQYLTINFMRLNDVLKSPIDSIYSIKRESHVEVKLSGQLEFRNVMFRYNPLGPPVIENLSFSLKPGMRLAIVGPSGSGKSTVAKLASGLLKPSQGEILYDGKPRNEIASELFCRSLASVDEEIFFFAGTVKENLTFWNLGAITEEMLTRACHDACIHEALLARDPLGYEAHVIEMGRNLSGGERQRLEIARALLFSPTLLILDEATRNLDSEVEEKVIENIRKRGAACLVIAHRLNSIQNCDEILVLDQGKLVQRGTHQVLREAPGLYRELLQGEKIFYD